MIVVDAPRRTLRPQEYMVVLDQTRLALEEIDRIVLPNPQQPRLDWVIEDTSVNGVHRAVIVPRVIPANRRPPTVTATTTGLVHGVDQLRQRAEIPPLFSASTVERIARIGKRVGERASAVHLSSTDDSDEAIVDQTTVEHAKQATHLARSAYGSVQGRLSVLSARRRGISASVMEEHSGRVVTVRAADDATEQLRQAWGKRVQCAGVLTRNAVGQPIRLDLTELRVLPEQVRVSASDILGIAPDYTGNLTTEEFIRHVRRS
ncbi:MAG TPA: hypothetical protein VFX60_18965 [Micromonospora sp.]|nr:hypothetical protein [Micromonospora sp.]